MIDFEAVGLGLQYGAVRLVPADARWGVVGSVLAAEVKLAVADVARAVEHVGSTAVPGLLAKPIVDLAIGVRAGTRLDEIAEPMSESGWIYRGDAGDSGGWVFVLEDSPWRRVAHAHGVEYGSAQWTRYLQFRDLLRGSASAREGYGRAKQRLAERHPDGRQLYTAGKDATVQALLAGDA